MRHRLSASLTGLIFAGLLFIAGPAETAPKICKTPDGFVLAEGKGIGGTGMPEERGIGGTGIRADIGVYGRITGFGSICVNGMRIRYGDNTPVSDMGESASVDHLQLGQVVAVRAYPDGDDYAAREIVVEQSVAGRISSLDAESGTMIIRRQTVLANSRDALALLREGDNVAVSGLRRADGIIVAGYIKKISQDVAESRNRPVMFGPEVKAFALQGYIEKAGRDGVAHLANGMEIVLPDSAAPSAGQRILAFGHIDDQGRYRAVDIVTERADFPTFILAAPGTDGNETPAPLPEGTLPPSDVVPALPPVEIPALPIEVPALPIEVPSLPVDIPVLPVDVPVLPVDVPVLPDLPLVP